MTTLSHFCGAEREMHGLRSSLLLQTSSETTNLTILNVSWSAALIRTTSWAATCPWKFIFWILIWAFFRKISAQSATNMVNVFIKTFLSWNHGTKAVGAQWCSQTIVGHFSGKIRMWRTSGTHRQKDSNFEKLLQKFFDLISCLYSPHSVLRYCVSV